MIRYVCKSRARVGFVGCFFWEDKRVHERFFEEEKIKETHRESNKSATYTDVIGWLRVRVVIHESVTRDGLTVVD